MTPKLSPLINTPLWQSTLWYGNLNSNRKIFFALVAVVVVSGYLLIVTKENRHRIKIIWQPKAATTMMRGNFRALSIAACSATVCASSWFGLFRGRSKDTSQSGSLDFYSRCEGMPSSGVNNNAPFTLGSSDASPVLPIRMIRPNENLEIAFDTRSRTPIYVMEKLTKETLPERGTGGRKRRPNFFEEKSIERSDFRSRLSHYHKSGFDRGHMAPGADFPGNSTQETYTLSNIAPQDPAMNRGIWSSLEEWVRRLVHSTDAPANSAVYVVTGPLWLPRRQIEDGKFEYQHLGLGRPPSLVTVPTHFFKVVVVANERARRNPIQKFACFVVANQENLPSKKLEDYVVPWKDLETVTGLQFFPKWATPDWKDRADNSMKLQVLPSAGSNPSRLYLTDRSSAKMISSSKAKDTFPEHLCANQKCS